MAFNKSITTRWYLLLDYTAINSQNLYINKTSFWYRLAEMLYYRLTVGELKITPYSTAWVLSLSILDDVYFRAWWPLPSCWRRGLSPSSTKRVHLWPLASTRCSVTNIKNVKIVCGKCLIVASIWWNIGWCYFLSEIASPDASVVAHIIEWFRDFITYIETRYVEHAHGLFDFHWFLLHRHSRFGDVICRHWPRFIDRGFASRRAGLRINHGAAHDISLIIRIVGIVREIEDGLSNNLDLSFLIILYGRLLMHLFYRRWYREMILWR